MSKKGYNSKVVLAAVVGVVAASLTYLHANYIGQLCDAPIALSPGSQDPCILKRGYPLSFYSSRTNFSPLGFLFDIAVWSAVALGVMMILKWVARLRRA